MAARKKKTSFTWKKFISDRRSVFTSGLLALVIIFGGFFILNDISQTNQTNSKQNQTKTNDQKTKTEENKKPEVKPATVKANPPTTHTVTEGESLWKIAESVYNDGYRWTILASENGLTDPDHLEVGTVLKLPSVDAGNPTPAQTGPQTTTGTTSVTSYVVKTGDCLWTIAEKYYGTGFNWVTIRDANQAKVGLLPNGRPLITPGTVLTIPPN